MYLNIKLYSSKTFLKTVQTNYFLHIKISNYLNQLIIIKSYLLMFIIFYKKYKININSIR
jgi:hypothetical protein